MKFDLAALKLPAHIGFIMDGNGRWAEKRLLPRKMGHREGVKALKKVVTAAFDFGIKYVSVYAFSTENKSRPEDEKAALFSLIKEYFVKELDYFINNEVRVRFMGELSYFPDELKEIIENTAQKSKDFKEKTLNIALNYGSQNEIIRAVNLAVERGAKVTEESFNELLYTAGMPSPDLIIRTSGESRLSNFMLYQAAYSELIFTKTLWPDFNKKYLTEALIEFNSRNRRFGKVDK